MRLPSSTPFAYVPTTRFPFFCSQIPHRLASFSSGASAHVNCHTTWWSGEYSVTASRWETSVLPLARRRQSKVSFAGIFCSQTSLPVLSYSRTKFALEQHTRYVPLSVLRIMR